MAAVWREASWWCSWLVCLRSDFVLSLQQWIANNKERLQPPVGAELVFELSEDYIIIVVGGPNRRSDFHINMSEEFFYQLRGDAMLKVVVDGRFEEVHLTEGSIFLLPALVPHSPQRGVDTVGLVVERRRTAELTDGLRWYCDGCHAQLYEEQFQFKSLAIGTALAPIINRFYASEELRTCKLCKHVSVVPENRK